MKCTLSLMCSGKPFHKLTPLTEMHMFLSVLLIASDFHITVGSCFFVFCFSGFGSRVHQNVRRTASRSGASRIHRGEFLPRSASKSISMQPVFLVALTPTCRFSHPECLFVLKHVHYMHTLPCVHVRGCVLHVHVWRSVSVCSPKRDAPARPRGR